MLAFVAISSIVGGLMPRYAENLIGKTFGRLTVTAKSGVNTSGNAMWRCRCECGGFSVSTGTNLRRGVSKSCGCYGLEQHVKATTKHGHSPKYGGFSTEYYSWMSMKARCLNPKAKNYKYYGARGISVCKRWADSFSDFISDMGLKPSPRHSIERLDSDGDYRLSNCTWALPLRQANNRRNNTILEFNGEKRTVSEWARSLGMNDTTLFMRLYKSKWSVEKALTTPVKPSG